MNASPTRRLFQRSSEAFRLRDSTARGDRAGRREELPARLHRVDSLVRRRL